MGKHRGIPTYTQHTVAFPHSPMYTRGGEIVEEVSVSFAAKGGGTNGEFKFAWHQFAAHRRSRPALRVLVFYDGIGAFLDDRVQRVLPKLRRNPSPKKLIGLLEAEGIVASRYHLVGLRDRGDAWTDDQQRLYERLRRHEEGS